MNEGAGVHALDALREWHAALTTFRSEAGNAVNSMIMSLQQVERFLDEQQQYWRAEKRRAEEKVHQAKNDLQARKFQDWTGHEPDTTVQEKALRKALARLEFVEERLEAVRRWMQKMPTAIEDIFNGPARSMQYFLDGNVPRGLALLSRQIDALDRYVGLAAEPAPTLAPPPKEPQS